MKINPAFTGGMSGSAGGITASRNRYGQYLRRRAQPVNPASDPQSATRAAFSAAVTAWQTLPAFNQQAWTTYALNTPRIDSLGNSVVLTGQAAFIGAYSFALQMASRGAIVPAWNLIDAPDVFNRGIPFANSTGIAITEDTGPPVTETWSITAVFASASDLSSTTALFVGRPQNTSRNFYKGPYRLWQSALVGDAETSYTFELPENETPPFGGATGQLLPCRFAIQYADGRMPRALEVLLTIPEPAP